MVYLLPLEQDLGQTILKYYFQIVDWTIQISIKCATISSFQDLSEVL